MLYQNDQSIEHRSQRKHPRAEYSAPIDFKSFSLDGDGVSYNEDFVSKGVSKDINPGGIRFQTQHKPPSLSDVLWMGFDLKTVKTLTLCLEHGQRPLIFANGLLGKVVHIEKGHDQDIYDVGVSFVTKFNASLP